MIPQSVRETRLPGLRCRGKVRDIYDLSAMRDGPGGLMIVASDRISAFDVVMDEPVSGKGIILTQMSKFWLDTLPACRPHHLQYVVSHEKYPSGYAENVDELAGRAMVVKKAVVIPIECVVRGYVVGGGWKEYQDCGSISGIRIPAGLRLAERLPEPIFTPSTKAASGHDEPVSFDRACELLAAGFPRILEELGASAPALLRSDPSGWARATMSAARDRALQIYAQAAEYAGRRGIIIADTKFEFGLCEAELLLIDEVLTPDSSRFWPADQYRVGMNPPSFDKQFLRDYLESIRWPKSPPPPPLPATIIDQTRQRYLDAYRLLVGRDPF